MERKEYIKQLELKMADIANYNAPRIELVKKKLAEVSLEYAKLHDMNRQLNFDYDDFLATGDFSSIAETEQVLRQERTIISHDLDLARQKGDQDTIKLLTDQIIEFDMQITGHVEWLQKREQFESELERMIKLIRSKEQEEYELEIQTDYERPLDLTKSDDPGVREYLADYQEVNGLNGYNALMEMIAEHKKSGQPLYSCDLPSFNINPIIEEELVLSDESEVKLAGGDPSEINSEEEQVPQMTEVEAPVQPELQMTEAEADEQVAQIAGEEISRTAEVTQEKAKPKLMKKVTEKVKGLTFAEKLKIILGGLFLIAYPFSFIAPILVGAEIMGPEMKKKK